MILYIVAFITAVISIIEMYYRFKENTNQNTKKGIIRNILFPMIIVFSVVYGAYKIYDTTFEILYTQDDMYYIGQTSSTEKKLLLENYEKNVKATQDRYDNKIVDIDYKMRGLSYENEIKKEKLLQERRLLQDSLRNEQLGEYGYGRGRKYYYYSDKIRSINWIIGEHSQKDTSLTTDKVYEYHKNILSLMDEKQTNLKDLYDNYSKDLKLLEFEAKDKKKEIESERTKYVINLFLAVILFLVFLIIGVRKVYKFLKKIMAKKVVNIEETPNA